MLAHLVRTVLVSPDAELRTIFEFAFLPARYSNTALEAVSPYALYWSPISYSFLHADWSHLLMNSFWLLAFGGFVARRLGSLSFLVLFAVGALGGAAIHYLLHSESVVPMIGASAAVSACMGAAMRLPLPSEAEFRSNPAFVNPRTVLEALTNAQVLTFTGIWFAVNFIFGAGLVDIAGQGQTIAWEAHIGGFLAGFLLFGLIDRPTRTDMV